MRVGYCTTIQYNSGGFDFGRTCACSYAIRYPSADASPQYRIPLGLYDV